jgi:hypothetical protein
MAVVRVRASVMQFEKRQGDAGGAMRQAKQIACLADPAAPGDAALAFFGCGQQQPCKAFSMVQKIGPLEPSRDVGQGGDGSGISGEQIDRRQLVQHRNDCSHLRETRLDPFIVPNEFAHASERPYRSESARIETKPAHGASRQLGNDLSGGAGHGLSLASIPREACQLGQKEPDPAHAQVKIDRSGLVDRTKRPLEWLRDPDHPVASATRPDSIPDEVAADRIGNLQEPGVCDRAGTKEGGDVPLKHHPASICVAGQV